MRPRRYKRRGNRTGSICNLGKGRRKPWNVRLYMEDGSLKSYGCYATYKEAEEALELYNAQLLLRQAPAPGALDVTIGQCWEAWKDRELAGATDAKIRNYATPWNRRLEQIRDVKIRTMGPDDWQKLIDDDVQAGLSSSSVIKLVTVIHALNRYAMERDYIVKDYSQFLRLPEKTTKYEKGFLTHGQVSQVRGMADQGDRWAASVLILCYTGWRIDELLSLPVSRIDIAEWTVVSGEKTNAGRDRVVPICTKLRPYVQSWLDRGGRYLICKGDGNRYSRDGYLGHFRDIMATIELRQATPHWCRYTFNTMCHEAGIDELTQKWLTGHSTEADITHHYTKSTMAQLKAAVERLWWPG